MGIFGNAFRPGGIGNTIMGTVGDALLEQTGHKPIYAPTIARRQQQDAALRQALLLAQFKAQNPEPTNLQNEAQSFGYRPGTPEYQQYITGVRMKPTFITLGSPETGQTVINPMAGGTGAPARMPGVPTVTDQATFDAIPPGGHFYDPSGNLRQK